MPVAVRFSEHTRYDIQRDAEVVLMMASTNQGSYWTEIPLGSGRSMRMRRNEFKEGVVECIRKGQPPCQLEFTDE